MSSLIKSLTLSKLRNCIENNISYKDVMSLKTINGNTQGIERLSINLIRNCLTKLNYDFVEAGSQQSRDFRNICNIGLDIEVKKTDGYTVHFNDTLPNENINYIIIFTGKQFKIKKNIQPQILFINGLDLIKDDIELALQYQQEINNMRDIWSRKHKKGNAVLFKYMSVCPRATYKISIKHLLNSELSVLLMEGEQHSQSVLSA